MNKPTEAQKKEFWEGCGVKPQEVPTSIASDRVWTSEMRYPPIDLNNLFKYAVPKLQNMGYWVVLKAFEQSGFEGQVSDIIKDPDFTIKTRDDDPALALFWVLWQVKEAMK